MLDIFPAYSVYTEFRDTVWTRARASALNNEAVGYDEAELFYSGTTSLYEYLKGIPNISLPQLNEPHFFAEDIRERRSFYTKTPEEYFALFADATDDHIDIGEASVFYVYFSKVLVEIRRLNDAAKIILMLCNPVDIMVSLRSQTAYSSTETRILLA